jgi:hypothetical protein
MHSMIHNMDVHLNNTILTEAQQKNFRKAKLYINSGHDTTVSTVLSAMHLYDKQHIPGYAAIVIIELHKDSDSGKPFVKV